jgi:hypothetical protein
MTSKTPRPIYVQALPAVADPIKQVRAALKVLLRRFGLRCVSIVEQAEDGGGPP